VDRALAELLSSYGFLVIEGAGSPAELPPDDDVANIHVARTLRTRPPTGGRDRRDRRVPYRRAG
jgi:cobyric acid synthase